MQEKRKQYAELPPQISVSQKDVIYLPKSISDQYHSTDLSNNVLCNVHDYNQIGDTLYVTSADGYAIVDEKTDKCRVYLSNPSNHSYNNTYTDIYGKSGSELLLQGDPSVTYLSSVKNFTPNEQKILGGMK
jgi:hypothetical protein